MKRYPNHPKWMPRKLYKQPDLESGEKVFIPGMNKLAGNKGREAKLSEEDLMKIRLFLQFGKSIEEISKLYNLPKREIEYYLGVYLE